jgi:hypothetical protein
VNLLGALGLAATLWCSPSVVSQGGTAEGEPQLSAGEQALCSGDYGKAVAAFTSIVPYWSKNRNDGRYWIDTARGYFYALIATGAVAKARNFLTSLESAQGWKAADADHLYWNGSPLASFKAYGSQASTIDGMPGSGRDPIVDKGAAAGAAGNLDAAIAILSQPSDASGPSTDPSLQKLMLGNAYAAQRRWPQAFAAWVQAANSGHEVPEFDTLDSWNISALEMIYYYHPHLPPDARTSPQ